MNIVCVCVCFHLALARQWNHVDDDDDGADEDSVENLLKLM